jgi:hypothetical protein
MNVTLNLPDQLCQKARHRAVDERKSLSAWLAGLVERELGLSATPPKSLVEIFEQEEIPKADLGKEFPLEDRVNVAIRDFSFED